MASVSVSPDLLKRSYHSTTILNGKLYSWGGERPNMPYEHDSDKKRNLTSFVEIFDIPSLSWSRVPTVGIPPAAMMNYSCASISDTVYYFGGNCKPGVCYHNNVFAFSTTGNKWNEILYTDTKTTPMKKIGSGMISFSIDKEEYLLTIGGFGPTPAAIPSHSVYTPFPTLPNRMYTNEANVFCVSSSPAHWTVPTVTGTRPPPLAWFTLNTLPWMNRAVIFGGVVIDDTGGFYRTNDVYLVTYTKDVVEYTELECSSGGNCPKGRSAHSSTIITANNSTNLLVIGGFDGQLQPISDCWILDINKKKWKKIDVPDSVTRRFGHSISSYTVSDECVWIVITGGLKQYYPEDNTNTPITGPDTTVLVELVYSSDGWSVTGIWNSEQLVSNKTELQTRLIQHIVKDRIHKGTAATDLINNLTTTDSSAMLTKVEIQELRKTLREKTKENEKLHSDLSVSNSRLEGYMKLLLEKEEHEKIYKKMSLVKTQELDKLQQSKGHVESVTEPEEQSTGKDDKSEILKEEVEKLQSLVIEKDEDLTQLLLEKEKHEKIYKKMLLMKTQELDKLQQSKELSKVQRIDVGVQFNYASLETDHLQGVTISSSKLFTVHGDKPQSLIWEGHGFELHLPEGTCPPDKDCDVMVDSVVGGEFLFPKGVEPVSAIYLISAALKPHKSPLLKIQHCVALNKASKNACLSFCRASLKESRPPYQFRRVKGGTFDTHNQFGELHLPAFCGMAIGKFSTTSGEEESTQSSSLSDMEHRLPTASEDSESPQPERNYSVDDSIIFHGQVFYLRKQLNEWHFKFTVVKNLDAFTEYVGRNFTDHDADAQTSLRFSADHIELALDRKEASGYKGWTIEPHVHPTVISFKHACSFGYGKRVSVPPTCLMTVAGDNTVTNYVKRLNCPVPLKGGLIGDNQESMIYIKRTMEENDTPAHVQPSPNASESIPKGGASSQPVDAKAIITCIKEVFNGDFAELMTVVENSLKEVSAELFSSRLISHGTKRQPSYEAIITDFLSGLAFKKTLPLIIQHCEKLFSVFYRLGGPFADAGDSLKQSILETVREKLSIDLSFD